MYFALLICFVLQDAGVLPQPAECQLFSCADSSRAETSESHQPSAKWVEPAGPLHLSPPQQTLHPRTRCSFISKHSSFLWRQITLLFFTASQAATDPHIVERFIFNVISTSLAWKHVGLCDVHVISNGWDTLHNNLRFLTAQSLTHSFTEIDEGWAIVKYSEHQEVKKKKKRSVKKYYESKWGHNPDVSTCFEKL